MAGPGLLSLREAVGQGAATCSPVRPWGSRLSGGTSEQKFKYKNRGLQLL